jgi:hypothetical protein
MTKSRSGVNRGAMQPPSTGNPGRTMSAAFRPGSDDGPTTRRAKRARSGKPLVVKVNGYPRQFQTAAQQIERALRKEGR